ncbi:MAG TPA: phosphate ABC transporter substrate-binding protein [Vicinamibacterales bacterium]|nr:phosphate ABC transporter substrate-binding protein [Vicinamibacterales bacterium]
MDRQAAIRITGSDTMINLVQAFAETYRRERPDISIQVAGGGTGVGIAGLIEGILEIAAAGRQITAEEVASAHARHGTDPREFVVALDALAVYVHRANPIPQLSLDALAEIYGDGGGLEKWSQLQVLNTACRSDAIVRIGRQNSSGTYAYFREAVLGARREYKLGSIDQNGSKDVVTLVSRTPCAIGYSGIAFAFAGVRAIPLARYGGEAAVPPTATTARDGSYPLARALYFYTPRDPSGPTREFITWVQGPAGQEIADRLGYVAVAAPPHARQQGAR